MRDINSHCEIFEFISSRLQCERKKQCENCDQQTNSKLPKEIKRIQKFIDQLLYFIKSKMVNII